MKYIIEIEKKPLCVFDKDTQTYFPRLWRVKGFNSLVFDEEGLSRLEELNSDYINEHYGDLQNDAYQKGLEEGKKATWELVADASSAEYQRGLDEAWEAAKKIIEMTDPPYWEVFSEYKNDLFGKITASEAIEKLKVYEEKQKADDEIKVGDEVIDEDDKRFWVTKIHNDIAEGIMANGEVTCAYLNVTERTGRRFDIDKILEEMKK